MKDMIFPYGQSSIRLNLKHSYQVVLPPSVLPLKELNNHFQNGFAPLMHLAKNAKNATIVVSDGTRATASHLWLPALLDNLKQGGLLAENIKILVACGSHRATTDAEKKTILGDNYYGCIRVIDHDAKDEQSLVNIGTTEYGTPVLVNRLATQCDLLIITGVASLHYFAGFGGGAKSILPGISGWETIKTNHFRNFRGNRRNPLCYPANDLDNPIFLDMQSAARLVNISFMVNVVMDSHERLTAFYAGTNWEEVAKQARLAIAHQFISSEPNEPADMVIVSAGGEPFDRNFIQAHKALEFASKVLKPGGVLLGLMRCREGIGSPPVLKYLTAKSLDEFFELMEVDYHPHGQCAFAMREKCEQFRVILNTDLDEEIVHAFGAEKFTDPTSALREASRNLNHDAKIIVIPYGHHVLPRVV